MWYGLKFFLSWTTLLLPYAAAAGVILFVVARGLERLRTPRIAVAVVSALFAAWLSGYLAAGIGWYISIATPAVYFAMVLGGTFGAFALPRRRFAR